MSAIDIVQTILIILLTLWVAHLKGGIERAFRSQNRAIWRLNEQARQASRRR